jgi:CHAT domain-containing protein
MGGPLEPALTDTLRALEERLQKPLREEIAGSGWTRIALILTGRLALLPIPAGLLDDACVTVQANARALAASMAESHRSNRKVTALVIGNPLPTLNPLPGAEMEAAIVARYFSVSTVMTGAAVERDKVIDALKDASHLHFACHGLSESADPLSSALYLGEEKLMVRDLLFGGAAPTNARLATLSACQSAIPDIARLPDEMIGLPLAFLQASVPGVVGTLWPVSDLSTAALMNRFYAEYLEQSAPPDEALSRAQRWLRDVTAAELAEYFRVERSKPEAERVAPYETLSAAWRRFVALEPDTAPFRSPTYWAAFVYYGS